MSLQTPEIYRFGVALTKSYTTTDRGVRKYILEGVASDQTEDQQGDTIIQAGLNFRPLLDLGIINWDHKEGPENIIGEPLTAEIQSGPALFVQGSLYVDDVERAKHAWTTAEAMRKSGGRRRLGWSVEGAVLQRRSRQITRSEVWHLALTHQPVNANSWADIVKSMTTATVEPLMLENLDDRVTSVLWGDCLPDRRCYHDSGYFFGGRGGMLEHLVKCRGMGVDKGAALIKRLINSGIQ